MFSVISICAVAQNNQTYVNSAEKLLATDGKLVIGGYGEVHYNQPLDGKVINNGKLDVHRMVMLFGYRFNERAQFVTELEFEHVSEVYVEQAFLQYRLNNSINFRGGLLLTPMGIVNEYHEPTTFNGVERPLIDGSVAPTTWREIGFGFTGNIIPAAIRYQAYLVNGFKSFDEEGLLKGSNGFRSGRQKGAESFASSPNFTSKIEYYGIKSLNIGLSGYFGKTQSSLYNGLDKDDDAAIAIADSSVVGLSMIGVDARYNISALQFRGQLYYAAISNTDEYNQFASTDLGSSMMGYYAEVGYNVLASNKGSETAVIPFVRYSAYNTHNTVVDKFTPNESYEKTAITAGITCKLAKGAVLKTDLQFVKSAADNNFGTTFNAGVGVMF